MNICGSKRTAFVFMLKENAGKLTVLNEMSVTAIRKLQEHHEHFEAPSPACLSGWAPEFASWTHWPDRPPSPRELGRQPGELFMTVLQLQRHMQTVEEIMQDGQHPTGITEWDAE